MSISQEDHTKKKERSTVEYQIRVLGYIDVEWSDSLNGLHIQTESEEEEKIITTLSGPLPDQSALMGILNFLYNHRLWLLSVSCQDYPKSITGS